MICGKTTLDRDLGESPRGDTELDTELVNKLDLDKDLGRDLDESPRLGTEVGTVLGSTSDLGKEAEAGSGTSVSSRTLYTIEISNIGLTSCGQYRRPKENPEEIQQQFNHQIQYQHLQVDLQRNQELHRVCL